MQHTDFILLLHKRFTGEISAEETTVLDEWIKQSPQNARVAMEYQLIWENAGGVQKIFTPDLDGEYRRLQQRLTTPETPRVKIVPIGQRLMRLAAVLAVLIFAVWGYRQFATAPPANVVEYAANVEMRYIKLPDGSKVWLRQNGSIEYPQAFDQHERRVKLNGEAYFEVVHNPAQPFRVDMPSGGTVTVMGTAFNVVAYSGQPKAVVLVRNGKVRFSPDGGHTATVLLAYDRADFNRATSKLQLSKVATFNELSWQTGGLEFVRTPLKDVIADLEKYYHVKIELRNPALRNCLHTAPLTNQPLDRVLESLSLTYQIQVSKPAPGQFILTGGSCQ